MNYLFYGHGHGAAKRRHEKKTRAAAYFGTCDIASFVKKADYLHEARGQKVVVISMIQSFKNEEDRLDPNNPADVKYVNGLGQELASRLYPNSETQVVTHVDGEGGKLHNHIETLNFDYKTGRAINENRRLYKMREANDDLMKENSLSVIKKNNDFVKQTYATKQNIKKHGKKWAEQNDFDSLLEKAIDKAFEAHPTNKDEMTKALDQEGVKAEFKPYQDHNGKPQLGIVYHMLDKNGSGTQSKSSNRHNARWRRRKGSRLGLKYVFANWQKTFQENLQRLKQITLQKQQQLEKAISQHEKSLQAADEAKANQIDKTEEAIAESYQSMDNQVNRHLAEVEEAKLQAQEKAEREAKRKAEEAGRAKEKAEREAKREAEEEAEEARREAIQKARKHKLAKQIYALVPGATEAWNNLADIAKYHSYVRRDKDEFAIMYNTGTFNGFAEFCKISNAETERSIAEANDEDIYLHVNPSTYVSISDDFAKDELTRRERAQAVFFDDNFGISVVDENGDIQAGGTLTHAAGVRNLLQETKDKITQEQAKNAQRAQEAAQMANARKAQEAKAQEQAAQKPTRPAVKPKPQTTKPVAKPKPKPQVTRPVQRTEAGSDLPSIDIEAENPALYRNLQREGKVSYKDDDDDKGSDLPKIDLPW